MKICVILIFSLMALAILLTKSNAKDSSKNNSSVNECNSDDWFCTNTTMKWDNDTKNINIICQSNELSKNETYKINILISGCENMMNCNEEPIVVVKNINCGAENLSELHQNACKVGMEIAKVEEENEFIQGTQEDLFNNVFCININEESRK